MVMLKYNLMKSVFLRVFGEKPTNCMHIIQELTDLAGEFAEWNSYFNRNGLVGQFWQMESTLSELSVTKSCPAE